MSHTTGDRSHKGLNTLPPTYQSEIDPDTARHALTTLTRHNAADLAPMLGLAEDTTPATTPAVTHCSRGHAMTGDNVGRQMSGKYCRECRKFNRTKAAA